MTNDYLVMINKNFTSILQNEKYKMTIRLKCYNYMLKKIEKSIKNFLYKIIKLIFRNKQFSIPVKPDKIKKILILRYDVIGDMIVTLPAIDLLKQNLPNAEIHIICSERNFPIIKNDNRINKIFILEKKIFKRLNQLIEIRKEKYDIVFAFVFNRTTTAGFISNLVANKNTPKINIFHSERYEMYSAFFNILINIEELRNKYTMAELLVFIICDTFGWKYPEVPIPIQLQLNHKNFDFAENFIKQKKLDKFCILNISAGSDYRQWSVEKNTELLKIIFEKDNEVNFVITSSPKEIEKAEAIKSFFSNRVEVFPKTYDILDIAAIISKSELVITPDTSITHLSAAFRIPIILLYSTLASHSKEWEPLGSKSIVVSTKERKALEFIEVKDVISAFFKMKELVNKEQAIRSTS